MDALVQLVQDLSKVRTLPEIINIVRSAARRSTGADGATFVLRDNGYCFYVDEDAIGPLWKGKRFPLQACISGWSMLNKKPVAIADIFKDSRIPVEAYRPTFVKSLAMVPIRQNDPIGAIGNYWATEHQATEKELQTLQAIADATSVAIENIHLFEDLQERVHQLEAANKVKDEFLMLISHELRTPLNSILGWSEMLMSYAKDDPEQLRMGLQSIYRNSKIQNRVVDSLLDASSIVLGQFAVKREEIDTIPIVNQVLREATLAASKKGIYLSSRISLTHALVYGDRTRLRQVFENLLDNAIKFSEAGSQITVEVLQEGPSLCFKVRDSGIGIDASASPDIFNRFSQSEKYMTRTHGGLGLGLTIAKQILDAHQGQIQFTSQGLGHGCEFTVSLPFVSLNQQPQTRNHLEPHQ